MLDSQAAPSEEELAEIEARAKLREAVTLVEKYVGCGDNSCLFVKPRGMATNGGCRCVGRGGGRPFAAQALAKLFKAATAYLSEGRGAVPREKKARQQMKRVRYAIYKKVGRWPGESYDYDLSEREAVRLMRLGICNKANFRIVRVTTESYTPTKRLAKRNASKRRAGKERGR